MGEPLYPGREISLLEVPHHLHQAERGLYEVLANLRPLLSALQGSLLRTPELESASFIAVQAGQQLEAAVHSLRSTRAVFAAEAELEVRARALVATGDGGEA